MNMAQPVKVGIIGGTGLDNPDLLKDRSEIEMTTQFGKPSDALIQGTISGIKCVLLARHGRKHTIIPTHVNYRANIHALSSLGCTHVIVTTACGSLREDIHPGDIVVLDQFIDRTTKRNLTFYDGMEGSLEGIRHVSMNEPFCPETRQIIIDTTQKLGIRCHPTGTTVTIEGPRFSTKAESMLWRSWGASIVNMTTVPEAQLAKELGLCYAAMALVTDYDCWKEDEATHVTNKMVLDTFEANAEHAINIILHAIPKIAEKDWTKTFARIKEEHASSVGTFTA